MKNMYLVFLCLFIVASIFSCSAFRSKDNNSAEPRVYLNVFDEKESYKTVNQAMIEMQKIKNSDY